MTTPLLGIEEEAQGNASAITSENGFGLKERNYLGLSDCSSVDSSSVSCVSDGSKSNLNLKATELRLGLPGSLSPVHDSEPNELNMGKFEEKPLFPLLPSKEGIFASTQKNVVSGNKRVFSDAMDGVSEIKGSVYTEGNWMFSGPQPNIKNEVPPKVLQERPRASNGTTTTNIKSSNNNASAPAAKAQVVGWPPIRSYRKITLATSSKNNDEVDGKPGAGALFVKVSMDGAPYLRKVDLRLYTAYRELSSALEKMFSCFTIGQSGSNGTSGMEMSEIKLKDLLHGSEYVVTYEDKDGDWMLVGDVPWEMFIESCKRLKIMKGSDAIGLAPRASEKSKNKV